MAPPLPEAADGAADGAADRLGPAGLASLLLHGGALLFLLAGLPAPQVAPPPQVIELAFLPAAEAPAEAPAEAAVQEASAEPLPEAEPLAEPAMEATAEPVTEATAEPVTEATAEPLPEEAALQAPPEPQPAPPPAPQPAPRARVVRPRTAPRTAPTDGGGATAAAPAPAPPPTPQAAPASPARAVPQSYIAALFAALERRKEYPEAARWRRAEGIAILRVLLRRDGSVQSWRLERGTGHEDLDLAVAGMVRRAAPLPPPPPELPGEVVEFSVPVRFSLR